MSSPALNSLIVANPFRPAFRPSRRSPTMSTLVPVVDLSSPDAPAAIDAACRESGFFQVVNHGLDLTLAEDLLAALETFFHLPAEVKLQYPPPSPDVNNGYSAIGAESLAYSLGVEAPPDLFEALNFGPEDPDLTNPAVAAERDRIFAPNIWPAEVPELRTAGVAYFDAAVALAHRITAACAVGLGLPSDFFEAFTGHSTDTMRCNWYSRVAGSPDPLPGQQRMGAHTDYGIVTVLYADRVPGLELLDKRGEWIGVVPEPGAYLVNVGDLLAQWSNDRWVSTLHRVVPPPATTDGPSLRRSIAFFHDGDWDAMIQCLPTCCSEDEPPKYAPVRALDHLLNKLVGGRAMEPAETTAHIGDRIDAVRS